MGFLTLLLLAALILWIVTGYALFWYRNRHPRPGTRPLVRTASQHLCLVGDRVEVSLRCSAVGLPETSAATDLTPWDIILVMDHSLSMGTGSGSALAEAKQAAINLAQTTPREFRFAVVEFDHEARALCPLTHWGWSLRRALRGIRGGGGTDIALGLDVAGNCLHYADAATARKRALILLSDGASTREPALAAAEALKAQDVLIITVGLGAADMGLLRELASTPDHGYRADQLDELTALYGRIGRMMAGRLVSNVEISERFNMEGGWGLRAWGELEPTRRVMREGRFSWLLASVEENPTQLSYFLEALSPGWHDVAPEPAVLSARLPEGRTHEATSNQGPRLLVLPKVPGWQFLWLVINPLFFILFGRWLWRKPVPAPRKPPVRPKPEPLTLPALIPVSPPPVQHLLPLRPSLIIGLGHGGSHALVHCKRLLWERGERADFDRLRFLAMDTTSEAFFPNPVAGPVTLEAHEKLRLNQPLEHIIATEIDSKAPRYPWLPAHLLAAGAARPDLWRGTGHQRVLGRLALVSDRSALEARLQTPLEALHALAGPAGIDILITATSGGGTASGTLLDLCWMLRRLLEDLRFGNASISLFLMTPFGKEPTRRDERQEKLQTHLRLANSQALSLELDRVAWLRSEPLAPLPGTTPVRRWFDRVFYVGPAAREEWRADTVLYPKGGEALFCWLASEDFCDHFKSLDTLKNDLIQRHGHCFVDRIDPNSYFLYPRTVARYLASSSLRRKLLERLWPINEESETPSYSWRDSTPTNSAAVREKWFKFTDGDGDFPWIFMSLDILQDQAKLQQSLQIGAGPGLSADISPLERSEYLQEQRELVRAVLDRWVIDTLNGGLSGVCEAHSLSAIIHTLHHMNGVLIEGIATARHLEVHSEALLVRDEAGLVAELASQAAAEVGVYITQLSDWDAIFGEGTHPDSIGLMHYLDRGTRELRGELERLMRETFPRLPLTWEDLEALRIQSFDTVTESILEERAKWWFQRNGIRLTLALHLKGTDPKVWTLDDMAGPGQIDELTETLIKSIEDLVPAYKRWRLQDLASDGLRGIHAESPRSDGLNPGAQGLYLTQGDLGFELTTHVNTSKLAVVDDQESRVIGCEQNLSTELLWPHDLESTPPFIFNEEFHAYRAYDAYCRDQGLLADRLPPALVGLCRSPNALLGFALIGLAGNAVTPQRRQGRQFWVASLDGENYELAEFAQDAVGDFLGTAKAWIGRDEPALSRFNHAIVRSLETTREQMSNHRLVASIAETGLFARFIGVIWGLLLLQGKVIASNPELDYQGGH